jgi:phosphomannomutase
MVRKNRHNPFNDVKEMNPKETVVFDLTTQKNVDLWLDGQYDEATKSQIRQLLREDPKLIVDSFYTNLTFGTGGLRGLTGVGTNRMNVYTVRAATQGLANYIQKQPKEQDKEHAVGNNIRVFLFKNIRPTPLVSFGCRYKKCLAAIMITASHNPPAYNGYKVYWSDGGQVIPPHDQGIIDEATKITDPSFVKMVSSLSNPLIQEIDTEIDDAYIRDITTLQNYPEVNRQYGHQLKSVYTSLHGTGITIVPRALQAWGFPIPTYVEPQIIPDGSFPTVNSPNPEEHAALKLGIDVMLETESDLLIATDPDADRMGIAVRHQGDAILLNGNQIVSICLEHICEALDQQKRWPERAGFVKSIATTELFQAICEAYQRPCFNVLTGFKYIAEKIHEWETLPDGYQYVFGGEESYGTLLGTFARDKDAVLASALISEVALQAKLQGKTLLDKLDDLYRKYGIYQEALLSVNFGETKEGKEQMASSMQHLREAHLDKVNDIPVVAVEDYQVSTKFYLATGKTEHLFLPVSDVILYWLADGSKVMIRPSGTEPKVKLYCGVVEKNFASIEEGLQTCKKHSDSLLQFMKEHLMKHI